MRRAPCPSGALCAGPSLARSRARGAGHQCGEVLCARISEDLLCSIRALFLGVVLQGPSSGLGT
eukprot:6205454-Pyramimonas_sp.AAC.1